MTTWPWANAELHAARARIAELEAQLVHAKLASGEWEDEAHKATAAIVRVRELCERTHGSAASYRDLVVNAAELRAALDGTDPEATS